MARPSIDLSDPEFPDPESEAGRALSDGFDEHFELREFDDLEEAIMNGEVDLVVSRDRDALEVCVEEEVTYFSTAASARAALSALDAQNEDSAVEAVGDRPTVQGHWGA